MDRRRFVPSTEGLEGRALLTSLFGSASSNTNPADEVPMTFALKEARIERLPHFLEQIRPGRFLPPDVTAHLKTDLLAVAGKLHSPGPAVLDGFNSRLRQVEPSSSLSKADAAGLNRSFRVAVTATGATPQQVQNLADDMNALARVDANSPQPVFLATNDYTLVLETVLMVGRPIRRPTVPQLEVNNGDRVAVNVGVTTKRQPVLVGNYDAFATMQVVDASGNVFGGAVVKKFGPTQVNGVAQATGKYGITIDRPLADGTYTFFVRAIDAEGNMSHLSPQFTLKVISPPRARTAAEQLIPPGGPLNLKH
jgi:hypothetical protein